MLKDMQQVHQTMILLIREYAALFPGWPDDRKAKPGSHLERFTRNNSGTLLDLTKKEDVGLLVKRSRSSTENLGVSFLPCGDLEDEKFASPRTTNKSKKDHLVRWHSGSFVTELVH